MEPRVEPSALRSAARAADALVYVAGVVGVVAGGLLLREGRLAFALLAWVLTFVAGAVLRLASELVRALAELLARQDRVERALDDLARDRVAAEAADPRIPDPYRRWGHH